MLLNVVIFLLLCRLTFCADFTSTNESRVYDLKKCGGAGCPYTASWLAHVNLFRKLTWYLDSTKMEAASFVIFDKAKLKFQVSDPDAYYVHHMSMYEHLNHRKYGFDVANNKTVRLSEAAFNGECSTLQVSKSKEYMALIPFFGGRPPGVNAQLKVESIGKGNSLVGPSTKARMAMATICSCLRYFGHVTVGVARLEDRILINEMISSLSSHARHRINVIQLSMTEPANLPFHLLHWGQHYVRRHNCQQFYFRNKTGSITANNQITHAAAAAAAAAGLRRLSGLSDSDRAARRLAHFSSPGSEQDHSVLIDVTLIPPDREEYEICHPTGVARAVGTAINVTYTKKNEATHHAAAGSGATDSSSNGSSSITTSSTARKHSSSGVVPIKYVYFSECDQVVRFDSVRLCRLWLLLAMRAPSSRDEEERRLLTLSRSST